MQAGTVHRFHPVIAYVDHNIESVMEHFEYVGDHVGICRFFVASSRSPPAVAVWRTRWLVRHGYADDEIGKAIGENVMRAISQSGTANGSRRSCAAWPMLWHMPRGEAT